MTKINGVIVVPCFNEANRFNKDYFDSLLKAIGESLLETLEVHILFVDDGSTDNTHSLLEELLGLGNVSILRLERNVGKANAIRMGFLESINRNYSFFAYLDSDGAFDSKEVANSLSIYVKEFMNKNIDLLSFARVSLGGSQIIRKSHRHLIGRVISTILVFRTNYRVYDLQSGFKVYSNSFLNNIDLQPRFRTRWFVDWEILLRSSALPSIVEIPIKYWHDVSGSKLSLRHGSSIAREIAVIKQLQFRR